MTAVLFVLGGLIIGFAIGIVMGRKSGVKIGLATAAIVMKMTYGEEWMLEFFEEVMTALEDEKFRDEIWTFK